MKFTCKCGETNPKKFYKSDQYKCKKCRRSYQKESNLQKEREITQILINLLKEDNVK